PVVLISVPSRRRQVPGSVYLCSLRTVEVSARIETLRLAETFVISRSARDAEDVVQVELLHSGVRGYGEAAPIDRYGESAESALAYVEEHAELLGDDPFALEEIFERLPAREHAARAALDAALHDLQGKLTGQPVWHLLGLRRAGPPTTWTIWLGDPDDMARRAERAHGINVKRAKSGGIREAMRMVHAARALGLGTMLGCMIESGLGIAAGAHVASLFDHVDLDGNLLIAHDPWPGVQFADGVQLPSDQPGLGVRHQISAPR